KVQAIAAFSQSDARGAGVLADDVFRTEEEIYLVAAHHGSGVEDVLLIPLHLAAKDGAVKSVVARHKDGVYVVCLGERKQRPVGRRTIPGRTTTKNENCCE